MQQLYPLTASASELTVSQAYAISDRPLVRVNMVSSLDGAAVIHGHVSGLTNAADQQLLVGLRELADVVLVGANTARIEGYGSLGLTDSAQAERLDHGKAALPRLAVYSRSAKFDPSAEFLQNSPTPLILTTVAAAVQATDTLGDQAEIVGLPELTAAAVLDGLRARGYQHVLCEGGPHTLAFLVAAQAVDELCVTLTPKVVGGSGMRITNGADIAAPAQHFDLTHLFFEEGNIFTRYRYRRPDDNE